MAAYIFSILSCVADQLTVLFFLREYGTFRGSFLKANVIIDTVLILEHTILVFGMGLPQGGPIVSTFDTLFLLGSWLWLCKESVKKRLILMGILIVTALIGELSILAVQCRLFGLSMADMNGCTVYTLVGKILTLDEMFLIYVGIAIVLRLKKDRYRIRYLCSILFTIAAHFGFQICFTYLDWNHLTTAKLLCLQAFQLLLLILVIQQYFYFLRQHDFRIKEAELQGLQLEMQNTYQYYFLATEQFEEASRIRHDYNNQIQSIQCMLDNQQVEEARALLHSYGGSTRGAKLISFCSTPIINVVLTIKTNAARNLGIETQCILQDSQRLELNNYELCGLFSNLLDNAIEACQQSGSSYRYIEIKGKALGQTYMLRMENSCKPQSDSAKVPQKTTKQEPGHGYGLKILQSIAQSHGGRFQLDILQEGCAVSTLSLPLHASAPVGA